MVDWTANDTATFHEASESDRRADKTILTNHLTGILETHARWPELVGDGSVNRAQTASGNPEGTVHLR